MSVDRIGKLKEDRVRAKSRIREWSQKKPSQTPLYLLKEQEFESCQQLAEQQRREEELELRKKVFKQISISEIRKHAKDHDHELHKKMKSMKRRREHFVEEDNEGHSKSAKGLINYNSKYLKGAIEEEKKKRILKVLKEKEVKDK